MKTFKHIILITLLLVSFNTIQAQQDPGFTQYLYNTLSINPGYAGTSESIDLTLLSRHQWVGFDGAPVTRSFSVHGPVFTENIGLGFSYVRDQIGPLDVDNLYMDYSYRIQIYEGGFLSMGLKAGLDLRKNSLSKLSPLDSSDPNYSQDLVSKLSPNFGAGLYYYTDNHFIGLSIPKIRNTNLNDANEDHFGQEKYERHYFVIGGYVFQFHPDWKLKPSFFSKHVAGAPSSLDINASIMYRETIIAGISHRFGDSVGAMMQVQALQNLWLGYAYDFTTSGLHRHNRGTHEVMVLFNFYPGNREIIKSPRFF
jgi:type IX secretion system PorP/SprF family membrane protein